MLGVRLVGQVPFLYGSVELLNCCVLEGYSRHSEQLAGRCIYNQAGRVGSHAVIDNGIVGARSGRCSRAGGLPLNGSGMNLVVHKLG